MSKLKFINSQMAMICYKPFDILIIGGDTPGCILFSYSLNFLSAGLNRKMNELCAGSKYNLLARRKFIILGVRYCVDGYESVHSRVRSGHDKYTN